MSKKNDVQNHAAHQIGNALSRNAQAGTDAAMEGMELLLWKTGRISNVGYEQGKGNIFEYIESAKLSRNMANKGVQSFDKNPITDLKASKGGFGENTAPDDFRLMKNGQVISKGQAKVNNDPHKTAVNFVNDKYRDMQRITTSDNFDEVHRQLNQMVERGEISQDSYENAIECMKSGLTDESSGIASEGTTMKELEAFRDKNGKISKEGAEKYAKQFERKQFAYEIGQSTKNGALAGGVIKGVISGTENMFQVLDGRKELDKALKDVGADVGKGAARGGLAGFLSSIIRIGGKKANLPVVTDSSAATVIASGVIDMGVSIYEYGKGEISSDELIESIKDTSIKSVSTIYFTKAIGTVVSTANPMVPIAIYTVASYVVGCTKDIIRNAKLNAQEYDRLRSLNEEALQVMKQYRKYLNLQMEEYIKAETENLDILIDSFETNIMNGINYDQAIFAMVNYSGKVGLALQHVDKKSFDKAMMNEDVFVLK